MVQVNLKVEEDEEDRFTCTIKGPCQLACQCQMLQLHVQSHLPQVLAGWQAGAATPLCCWA